jgi:hypothetical protein
MDGLLFFTIVIVVGLPLIAILFAPTIIAFVRHHPERWSIFGLNFALGGKGLGWGAALTWSLQNLDDVQNAAADDHHDDLEVVERECPYCAEIIKAKAIICRHCGSDLSQQNT